MTKNNFLNNPQLDVFVFGKPPVSIEILTNVKGLNFDEAYSRVEIREVEDLSVKLISYDDLLKAKQSAGRNRDIDDIDNLSRK